MSSIGSARQDVRFCRAPDGVRIAYAVHGEGPPLLVTTCWLSHLQHDWESPVWRHFLRDLGKVATIIRYDERGHGLSDREVDDFSLEARVGDMAAVAAHAGFERFAVMAMSQGGPVAIEYAVAHPERVTRMMFYGSYAAAMPDPTPEDLAMEEAINQIIKVGWARPTPEFRRVFTTLMIPGATEEQMSWLDELQRVAVTGEKACQARNQRMRADATAALDRLEVPTLILHSVDDRMNDFEQARVLASHIPGARLVPLQSRNHIVLEDEPAWPVIVEEVTDFMRPTPSTTRRRSSPSSGCCRRASSRCSGSPPTGSTTTRSPRR
jgi:pimeloyl-ACP methyl ester carboxylesterase